MGVLEELNEEQRRAATAGEGPVLIVAGPGTGKTKTLTGRIVHLVESGRAGAGQILALTFTRKAAEEVGERVRAVLGTKKPVVTTFHGFCQQLLEEDSPFIAEAERQQLIKALPRPKALKHLSVREAGLVISRAKNSVRTEDGHVAKFVKAYNQALADHGRRDFDDLLQRAYQLLQDEDKRATVQAKYSHILVDEFQDTNRLQYELLKLLAGHDNLFVIGDPNQSIYGFRGASGGIFEQFLADFPGATQITLTTNYRSVPEIVRLSNAVFDGGAVAHSETSGMVRAVEVLNEYGEANWILGEIQRRIGGGDFQKAISDDHSAEHRRLGDFAVLYRSRPAALAFQKVLAESGLPYQVVGEGSPYEQPEVLAILTLLRAATTDEPLDLQGFTSAQRRLLEEELAKVDEAVPAVLAEKLAAILGFAPSPELLQFTNALVRFKHVPAALAYFDGIAEHGFYDPAAEAITLLTIHASKGLEFPHVFLLGAEEGILPSARGDEAEERRLFYVAVTRARERLEVTHAKNRGGQPAERSRFVETLSVDVLGRHADPDMEAQRRRIAKRAAKRSQQSLF